jgi:hypothetical protein
VKIGAPGERRGISPQAVATGAEPVASGCCPFPETLQKEGLSPASRLRAQAKDAATSARQTVIARRRRIAEKRGL